MKKIIPYILIFFIFVNLFAPLSLELNNNKIAVNKNEAIAADCTVTSVTFTPAGGSTSGTAIPLPSSIIAKIKTANCIGKNIEFNIDESFNYSDESVFNKQFNVLSDDIEFKLNPTELKCGSENLCGFKYKVSFGALTTQYGWTQNFKSSNSNDYFYKCNTTGCTNQSPWTGVINSGGGASTDKANVNYKIDMSGKVTNTDKTATVNITVTDKTDYTNLGVGSITYTYYLNIILKDAVKNTIINQKKITYANWAKKVEPVTFDISPATKYTIDSSIDVFETTIINGQSSGKTYPEIAALTSPVTFTSNEEGNQKIVEAGTIGASAENKVSGGILPACGIDTLMGCVAQGIYYVLFQPTSYLFALSGTLFDNAFAYSVDDNSYRSPFVVEGWKVVRDFCNMFFIFILLYIAFGTILNLNGVKTKEMIINVVLIGIFINFSLFASQVIIDASNILARVFYNSNTITVKIEDSSVGSKVIPLSAALVNKINPQEIIISASKINTVQDTRGKGGGVTDTNADADTNISTGTFILVTLLATIVNLVGIFVFFSIAIIFIARVIGLWLAMIFVPFAFLSYTVPAMQDFDMVGWKKWWPETLKMAFLAPVFIFFLYLILQFIETGFAITQTDTQPMGLSLMIGIILPFVFIMLLLLKAKSLATKMSGTIGETLAKAGAAVGGMALGAAGGFALGGVAKLGRATIGNLGDKLATSEWASTHGAVGRGLQDLGKWTSGKSFDVRATKLGATAQKSMGVDLGKAKEGGYVKQQADITAKRRDRAERIKLGDHTPQVQELHHAEEELSNLRNERVNDTNRIDGTLAAKRLVGNDLYQKLTAANAELAKNKKDPEAIKKTADAQKDFNDNSKEIDKLTNERNDLNGSTGKYSHKTGNGKVNKKGFDDYKTNVVDKSEIDTKDIIDKANIDMSSATTVEAKAKFQKIIDDATKENNDIKEIFKGMEAAVKANGFAEEGKAHSINELALKMIPELHHTVEKENADRVNKYSETLRNRFFNQRSNDKAAHDAIMKSEIKKH